MDRSNQQIQLDNIEVRQVLGTVDGEGGDDVITGGAGSDEMFGQGGDDTFLVSSASDAAGDVVVGGNGPDQTADNDTLDLRGAGQVTIVAAADATDAEAQVGTVTFENGEVLNFSQIETILTDPQIPLEGVDDCLIVTEDEMDGDTETLDGGATSVLDNDVAEGGGQYAGDVVAVNGVDTNVGQFIDLAEGGRIQINANGTVDFDADGDFEDLDAGESATLTVEYTIQGPPQAGNPPKHNILFVVDVSGSTIDQFPRQPGG